MTTKINISNRKLLIDVLVANPNNTKIINSYKALIDTGSMETMLTQKVINDLGLIKSNQTVTVIDASGNQSLRSKYDCYLMINGHTKTFTPNCAIVKANNFDLIIGMDIIELIELTIKNNQIIITI